MKRLTSRKRNTTRRGSRSRQRRRQPVGSHVQQLEHRALLSASVTFNSTDGVFSVLLEPDKNEDTVVSVRESADGFVSVLSNGVEIADSCNECPVLVGEVRRLIGGVFQNPILGADADVELDLRDVSPAAFSLDSGPALLVTAGVGNETRILGSPFDDQVLLSASDATGPSGTIVAALGAGNDTYKADLTGKEGVGSRSVLIVSEKPDEGDDLLDFDDDGSGVSFAVRPDGSFEASLDANSGTLRSDGAQNQHFETIAGTPNKDSFEGSPLRGFARTYRGEGENDRFTNAGAADTYAGGTGNDGYFFPDIIPGAPLNVTVEEKPNEGTDSISFVNSTFRVLADLSQGALATQPSLNRTIQALPDRAHFEALTGSQANDVIRGSDRGESLKGHLGADVIDGRGGDDFLSGDNGDDFLHGGPGRDTVNGAGGADTFLDVAEVTDGLIDLEVTIGDTADPLSIGQSTIYSYNVTNNGPDVATEPVVTVELFSPISGTAPPLFAGSYQGPVDLPEGLPRPNMLLSGQTSANQSGEGTGTDAGLGVASTSGFAREKDANGQNDNPKEVTRVLAPGQQLLLRNGVVAGGEGVVNYISTTGPTTEFGAVPGLGQAIFGFGAKVADFGGAVFMNDGDNFQAGVLNLAGNGAFFGDPIQVDANGDGVSANSEIFRVSVADSGDFAIFHSEATNLSDLPGISPTVSQVYIRDLSESAVELVTVSHDGTEAGNRDSANENEFTATGVDASGRFVVFHSRATNLTAPGLKTSTQRDIMLRDRELGITRLVSRRFDGTTTADSESVQPLISANGKTVIFQSRATDLVDGFDTQGRLQLYAYDIGTEEITPVSAAPDGVTGGDLNSTTEFAHLSDDGDFLLFTTSSSNLVSGVTDDNGRDDVFLRDLVNGTTTLLSRNQANEAIEGRARSISADGRFSVFNAFNADGVDPAVQVTPGKSSVFRYSRTSDSSQLVNITPDGLTDGGSNARNASVSDDGRYVAFLSAELTLTDESVTKGGDTFDSEVYVRDMDRGITTLISINADGTATGNGSATEVFISGDGNRVLYESDASTLIANVLDENNATDIFSSARHRTLFFEVTEEISGGVLTLVRNGGTLELFSNQAADDGLVASASLDDIIGVHIIGLDDENDTLEIDLSGGLFDLQDGITFDGGAGGFDSLALIDGTLDTVTYQALSRDTGFVLVDDGTTVDSIAYLGLEPITDETDAAHRVFRSFVEDVDTGPTPVDVIVQDAGNGLVLITPGAGAPFEEVQFTPPTESLTISSGPGDDVVRVESLPPAFEADITLDGEANGDAGDEVIVFGADADDGRVFTGESIPDIRAISFERRTIAGQELAQIDLSSNSDTATLVDNGDGTFTLRDLDETFGGDVIFRPHPDGVTVNGRSGSDAIDLTAATFAVRINGGAGRDVLTGGTRDDVLQGGSGKDVLIGFLGADRQHGSNGADTFIWNDGDGPDDNIGGRGSDKFLFNGADLAGDVARLAPATDDGEAGEGTLAGAQLEFTRTLPSAFTVELQAFERALLRGKGGDDSISTALLSDTALDQVIVEGGVGHDTLTGGAASEELRGGRGRDTIFTGGGDNNVDGGFGADQFFLLPDGTDVVSDAGGTDRLNFSQATEAIDVNMDLFDAEQIVDSSGNKLVLAGTVEHLTGSTFDDTVRSEALPVVRRYAGIGGADKLIVDPDGRNAEIVGTSVEVDGLADIVFSRIEEVELL